MAHPAGREPEDRPTTGGSVGGLPVTDVASGGASEVETKGGGGGASCVWATSGSTVEGTLAAGGGSDGILLFAGFVTVIAGAGSVTRGLFLTQSAAVMIPCANCGVGRSRENGHRARCSDHYTRESPRGQFG